MGRGIHGHPSLALYSTIDAIICEPYVTTSLPWSCGCLVHCEQLKRQLAESQKEKEAIQKKNKAQLSRMAQKVFARLQGNEEGLREQEEERRECCYVVSQTGIHKHVHACYSTATIVLHVHMFSWM
eukprot:m.438733 g.438733  ORF g.438733 m.438733 type:complete len:126 (+) comp21445_c0_seq31:581-958(+)